KQELGLVSPPGRTAHAMTYDAHNGQLLVHGGFGESDFLGDTWEHQRHGAACTKSDECDSGWCIDGVCCSARCAPCEACDLGLPGVCLPLVATTDPDSCLDGKACDDR